MSQSKKNKLIDIIVFVVLLCIASVITFLLFHRQTLGNLDNYHSDMKAYILEMQGLDSGYDFPYPIFFKLAALIHLFTGPELAVALATVLLNSLGIVTVKCALNHLTGKELENAFANRKWLAGVLISVVSVTLFFVSMLFPPEGMYLPGIRFRCVGVFTGNPFHNATYMAARPFAMLAFLWCAKLLVNYEEGYSGKWRHGDKGVDMQDYVLFALFLLLATMTKPSFTIVLVGAAGLIMVYRMCRSRFRNFLPTIYLGICFIPTFIDLLYQYKGVFVPEEGAEGGIGFCFGEIWGYYSDNIPLSICLAVGFPLLVLILNYKELKHNALYRFSWQIYAMGFAMAFLLYEKGFRKPDFNFSWGYMYGIFFAFVGALVVLLQATGRKQKPLLLALQWLAYLWHVACGIYYFWGMLQGGTYY
ncbi:MAG: hypothetical protein E7291_03605 [Lachnospiraceae bacterium]|nr:hypothetical protein [Lachnospiraceae bacterium]